MNTRVKSLLKRRKLLIGVAVAAAIVAFLVFFSAPKPRKSVAQPKETAVVTRGDLPLSVEAKGQFQAEKSERINLDIRGGATLIFLVPEGTLVKKGDVLARCDTKDLESEIADLTINMENARNKMIQAQEAERMQQSANATDVTAAEVALRTARFTDEEYGAVLFGPDGMPDDAAYAGPGAPPKGDAYQAFRTAQFDIKQAESVLETARTNFEGEDKLLEKGFVTRQKFISDRLAVEEALKNLEGRKLAYQILREYTFPQTVAKNKQAVMAAEDVFKSARITAAVKMNKAETAYRMALLEYRRRKRRLDMRTDQLARLTVVSPTNGVLLYGDPDRWWSKDQIAVGNQVWRGMTLFTIPDLSSIIIKTRFLENDVLSATAGREADITVDALPGLVMKGTVTKVAEFASDANNWIFKSAGKAFDATIAVKGTDPRIKSGMSCVVNILLETIANTLYVPISAVSRSGEKDFCTVVDGRSERSVEVKTGKMSEKYVQILAGLKEGQKVVVSATSSAAGSQGGQPAAAGRGGG